MNFRSEKMSCNLYRKPKKRPCNILRQKLLEILEGINTMQTVPDDIPTKWERHGDLILIPSNSLCNPVWKILGSKVWDVVAETLKCQRVARKNRVESDDFRTPCIELLKGTDVWVTRIDNGIKCTFDVTKCMFSAGNISEKLRIANFNCDGETVVDMYAGIGYFTLPYLVHAKASEVHACEWNPDAVEALEKNLHLNAVKDKCTIHFGDNREVCPREIADRVNLGLIPSSECGWETACRALKPSTGGILHIHGVVTSGLHKQKQNDFLCINEPLSCDHPNLHQLIKDSLHYEAAIHSSSDEKGSTNSSDKTELKATLENAAEHAVSNKVCQGHKALKVEWIEWSEYACKTIRNILERLHHSCWRISILHFEHLKSYAAHMDHIVLDMLCKPG